MTRNRVRVLQWAIGGLLVALFFVWVDTSELVRLGRPYVPGLAGVLLCSAGLVWSAALRWRMLAAGTAGGGRTPLARYMRHFLLGRVLGFVLPAEATDVGVRAVALRRSERLSLAGAAYTVIVDRLLDLVLILWLMVPALLHLAGTLDRGPAILMGVLGILGTPCLVGRRHGRVLAGLARLYARMVRLLRRVPGLGAVHVPELDGRSGALRNGVAVRVYALSVVKLAMVIARFYFVAMAVRVPVTPALALVAVPLAQAAALAAVTPGGLGILEAGWYGILVWAGVPSEETVLLVVGWRLYTLLSLVCLLVGLRLWEAMAGARVCARRDA